MSVASGHRAGGPPGRVEVGRRLSAPGARCATGAGNIGPRVRPAQRPRGGRPVARLSTLTRGSAGGAGWGCLSAREGWGTGNRSKADPCSLVATGSPVHTGVEDRLMGWMGFLGGATEAPLLAGLLGSGAAVQLGAGPSRSRPALPRSGGGRSLVKQSRLSGLWSWRAFPSETRRTLSQGTEGLFRGALLRAPTPGSPRREWLQQWPQAWPATCQGVYVTGPGDREGTGKLSLVQVSSDPEDLHREAWI